MGFNLQNWLQEKTADINPFDGGKTGQTVRAQRSKPAPAQTVSRAPLQVGPAQTRKVSIQQAPQQNISVQPTRRIQPQGFYSSQARIDPVRLGKLNSQLNKGASFEDASDQTGLGVEEIREYTTATRPQYGVNKFNLVNDTKKFVGGMADAVADIAQKPATTLAPRKDAENAYQALRGAYKRGDITQSKFNQETTGLSKDVIGKKTTINDKGFAENKNQNALEFGQSFTDAGYNAASVIPVAKGAQIAVKSTGNTLRPLLKEAVAWGTTDTVNDAVQGRLSPEQTLVNYGLNAALPGAGYGVTKAVQKAAPVAKQGLLETAKAAKEVNTRIEQVNPQVAELDNHVGLLRQQEQSLLSRGLAENNAALINNRKAQTDALNTRQSLTQGGYIGPNKPTYTTPDVPKEDLIIKNGDGPAMSIAEPDKVAPTAEARVEPPRPSEELVRQIDADIKALRSRQAADEAVKRGFDGGPRNAVDDITRAVSESTSIAPAKAREMVERYAATNGYDTSSGRPFKQLDENHAAKTLDDGNGNMRPVSEIQPDKELITRIKRPGVENAIPTNTNTDHTPAARQMIYKDSNGDPVRFYQYKRPGGQYQKVGSQAAPVRSPFAKKYINEIQSNSTINAEAARAARDGVSTQYIWSENSQGDSAEIMRGFDELIGDTGTKNGRPTTDINKPMEYDPSKHYIDRGRVVEAKTGKILGNYLEINKDGVDMYAGSKKIHIGFDDFNLEEIEAMKFGSGQTWLTSGVIDRITGNRKQSNSVEYFKSGGSSTKESLMYTMIEKPRESLRAMEQERKVLGDTLNSWDKALIKDVPKAERAQALQDMVYAIEPEKAQRGQTPPTTEQRLENYKTLYGEKAASTLEEYATFMRGVYDNLLVRMNEQRLAQGKPEVQRRNDYITHIQEMVEGGAFKGAMNEVRNMLSGDVMGDVRNGLPASIAGKTGDFKPTSKYNSFTKQRVGDTKPTNPVDPLRIYSDVTLHNIHMSDAIGMNRSLETAFRALSEARNEFSSPKGAESMARRFDEASESLAKGQVSKDDFTQLSRKLFGFSQVFGEMKAVTGTQRLMQRAGKLLDSGNEISPDLQLQLKESFGEMSTQLTKIAGDTTRLNEIKKAADGLNQLTTFTQEHANKLAGKTHWLTRGFRDKENSKATDVAIKVIRAAQQQAALAKIVGNLSSALNQSLGLGIVLSTTHPKFQMQGLKNMTNKDLMARSNAVWLRYNQSQLRKPSKFSVAMEKAGLPLLSVEKPVVQFTFATKYAEAQAKGLNEYQSTKFAERYIDDTVGFRDVASSPKFYDSLLSAPLQFTREVTQQNRAWWNKLDKTEKAQALIGMSVLTNVIGLATGAKAGIDVIGSAAESLAIGGDDEEDAWSKAAKIVQLGLSDVASSIPVVSAAANTLPKESRSKLFGDDSNFGRFDGNIAALGLPVKAVETGYNLAAGQGDAAWKDAVGELPLGSQIKKTLSAGQALARGYTTTSTGKVKTTVDRNNPLNWALGLGFGPNAFVESRQDGIQRAALGQTGEASKPLTEKQTEYIKSLDSSKQTDYLKQVQSNRQSKAASNDDTVGGTNPADTLKQQKEQRSKALRQSLSEEDNLLMQLSETDRKKLVSEGHYTQEKIDGLANYYNNKKKELGYDSTAGKAEKDKADTGWTDEYNAAKKDHDENSKNWSAVERANKDKELKRLDTKRHFSKDTTTLYAMSKADVYDYVSQAKDGKKAVDEIVRYGDKMVEAGLYMYNKFRDKNGNVLLNAPGTTTAKGGKKTSGRTSSGKKTASKAKGTKAKKGKFEYKLDGFSKISSSNSKDLYDLMKMAKLKNGIS